MNNANDIHHDLNVIIRGTSLSVMYFRPNTADAFTFSKQLCFAIFELIYKVGIIGDESSYLSE